MEHKLYSIDEFLKSVPSLPQFKRASKGQLMGFRALMKSHNKDYTFNLRNYIPLLRKYLTE